MKCPKHNAEAIGICSWCGRALCAECAPEAAQPARRLTCSESCANASAGSQRALEMILQKTRQNARANAVYCFLCAAILAGATVAAWFELPSPLLMWFTGASSVMLCVSGFWFARGARKMEL